MLKKQNNAYTAIYNIQANGVLYPPGSEFPSDLETVNYESLLNSGSIKIVTPPPAPVKLSKTEGV